MAGLTLQPAFTSGELSPSLSARVDLAKYNQGCRTLLNYKVQPHGGATKRSGFLLLDTLPGEAVLMRFAFNNDQAYCLAFGDHWLRVFTAAGPVLDSYGQVYQLGSPYSLAEARALATAQSADVLYLACWGQPPRKLKRLAHNRWEFEVITFGPPLAAPGKPVATFYNQAKKSDGSQATAQLTTPYTYYVTAVDQDGRESELSPGVTITGPASNNWQGGDWLGLTWPAVAGAVEYQVYKAEFGGRPGFVAVTGELTYHDYNVSASLSEGAPKYKDPFPDGDWPGVVTFFEQRLVFASTPKRPQTIWLSKSGDYGNFAVYTPLTDDAALELTLASAEVSSMSWLAALRSLVLGSTSMEWEIGAQQAAFSAKSAKATPQSYIGSAKLPAIIVGNTILHVSRSGAQVRDMKYDFGSDSYNGSDLTIMATHLFERHTITGWTYQQHPDSIIWVVRSDGVLLGLTYQPEHQIFAWHRHETQGRFLSVCAVPKGHDDALFAVVARAGKWFLECQSREFRGEDQAQAVFLDCALVYAGKPVKTVSGLSHLEGMTVGILADGGVEPPQKVKDGAVRFQQPKSRVVVGLAYNADLETMPVEVAGPQGSSVGRKKRVNEVLVLFHQTAADVRGGTSFNHLESFKLRSDEPYGRPPRLFSGLKSLTLPTLAENVITVCLRSADPVPMTVLAVMPKVEVL